MSQTLLSVFYLISSCCFIMALRGLSSPKTAISGILFAVFGMVMAIGVTVLSTHVLSYAWIGVGLMIGGAIGSVIAFRIQMTALPQLVAFFHSLVGLAAVFVAAAAFIRPDQFGIGQPDKLWVGTLIEMALGGGIGAMTFSGSLMAFGKLQGLISGKPLVFKGQHYLNAALGAALIIGIWAFTLSQSGIVFMIIVAIAMMLGILLILPIGGADMPVVVSMLNSYSGWAASGIGFTLSNHLLIITGALVGASGAILSYIMCKGMNRSIMNVILGGFGGGSDGSTQSAPNTSDKPVKIGSAEDAAFLLKNAASVIIVPGYGMAVANAGHALKEMVDVLKKQGVRVRYAIHPVAGRMPGHMNVLLAEANVPYDDVAELDDINRDFAQTDVAFVIGANDVTNPKAKTDPTSPIYGMPILDVEDAKTVLFIKRSMGAGYAGVDNTLFYNANTMMIFGDGKKVCDDILKNLT